MKKGTLFLIISVIIVLSVALSACSLIKTNEERQANRVLATVTVDLAKEYGDGVKVLGNDWDYVVSLDVTRRELVATVNYAINYYSSLYSQYGLTYDYNVEDMLDSGLKTMKTQKYNAICAMGELLVNASKTGRLGAMYCETEEYQAIYGKKLVPEGVLTLAERYGAIAGVNETFQSRLEGYMDEQENDERNHEKSEANDALAALYRDGYFVSSVSMAYKEGTEYKDGLYTGAVIDDGDDKTSDIDYTKVYAKVKLTKKDAEDKYVYAPAESTAVATADDADAEKQPKYLTAKYATVSYSGRVYAEVTEDNDAGYEVESFTSDKEKYTLVTPRSAAKTEEDTADKTEELVKTLRYTKLSDWANADALTEDMKTLKADIFNANPDVTTVTSEEKDAYRQIRSYFESSNVGYITEEPSKNEKEAYNNYKYYNGLAYYYKTQFESYVLECIKAELSAKITEATEAEINAKYETLVLKDKANYDYLTNEEKVKKFFDTVKGSTSGIDGVYYVPIEALTSVSYEIKPTDKAYKPLFTFDNDGNVTGYNTEYVFEEDGKYKMYYASENADGSYVINMIYTTHVLFSFDNVVGLADKYKAAAQDFDDETKMAFIKEYVKLIKTCPQLLTYLADYDKDKTYAVSDVFETDENGELVYKTYAEAEADMEAKLSAVYASGKFEDLFNEFFSLTEVYNDDSGKVTTSGYLVSAGNMANGWYQDFTDTALNMYFTHLVAGENPTADGIALDTAVQDAYSDYGVHKMFLCYAPFYGVKLTANGGLNIQTKVDAYGVVRWDTLGETVITEKQNAAYTKWREAQSEDVVNKHSTTNEKNYKSMIKDLK